jgi:hypothetical protein
VKLTKKQKEMLRPYLRDLVQNTIEMWETQRCIEGILGRSFDGMSAAAETFAVSYDHGFQVTLDDVQTYIDSCVEEG